MAVKDVVVIGAGIVGLSVARAAAGRWPSATVTVLEKERTIGEHQTGHNSGVVHAGLYYQPGSLKATLCSRGRKMLREYCQAKSLAYEQVGKLVVAVRDSEQASLLRLYERGVANGVPRLKLLSREELRQVAPGLAGHMALSSPETAIVDYREIARALADDVSERGAIEKASVVTEIVRMTSGQWRVTTRGRVHERYRADLVFNCAGLNSDRIARMTEPKREMAIIPFRGEYYWLESDLRQHIRQLIYPVPDPRLPFLGVHLTPTLAGGVLVGPNAVLATAREGYSWSRMSLRDMKEVAVWPGFWKMARTHWRAGAHEILQSASKRIYCAMVEDYLPGLRASDLRRAFAGVRAQVVGHDGTLVDDFQVTTSAGVINLRNAPSPAATSSLALADLLCDLAETAA